MGKRRYLKVKNKCVIQKTVKKGVITFKCKGLGRAPYAEELIRSLRK